MTNPTSNFGWQMPTSTDLVTDLPADFEVFGQAVDTSLADLKGGTTGQVLAKASNANMDFVWTADASGIPASSFTAKGNILVGTGASTFVAQTVGANGTVLTADSAEADGVKWVAPTTPTTNWSLLNTGGTALTAAATITVSGISSVDKIMILVQGASASNDAIIRVRFNGDSASNYSSFGPSITTSSGYVASNFSTSTTLASSAINLGSLSDNAASVLSGYLQITGCNSTGQKMYTASNAATAAGGVGHTMNMVGGFYNTTSSISSVSILSTAGNFDAGTIYVYTSA